MHDDSSQSDSYRDLIEGATRGDQQSLETLLTAQLPTLAAFLRLHAGPLLRGRESISDLAQSVCRDVLEAQEGFEYRGAAPFRKWLYQKALSKILDRQRYYSAQKRNFAAEQPLGTPGLGVEELAVASFFSPSRAAIREEDLAALELAFAKLSEDHRQIITLVRLFGYSHAQAAEEMGRSEGAVRGLLHRALASLAWEMDASDEPLC